MATTTNQAGGANGKRPDIAAKLNAEVDCEDLAERLGLVRQWLHAVELGFLHPASGERVVFTSPYPDDLAQALELVRQG